MPALNINLFLFASKEKVQYPKPTNKINNIVVNIREYK